MSFDLVKLSANIVYQKMTEVMIKVIVKQMLPNEICSGRMICVVLIK